ncbi:hypothetical protein BCR44DRAFT_1430140 [Catenaria anguillulae PL171]|uniref:Uncharacterized protein n=1 Tax=Catenaria anguillulae PL171 TaxID=765915 RepID=A0A1Y2HVZ8_9FUNG|nr:hypothetical protein BCR44DRAFT_1430140 [Catenaria anguillulae PL171]
MLSYFSTRPRLGTSIEDGWPRSPAAMSQACKATAAGKPSCGAIFCSPARDPNKGSAAGSELRCRGSGFGRPRK